MVDFTSHFKFGIPDFTQEPWHEDWKTLVHHIDTVIFQAIVAGTVQFWDNEVAFVVGDLVIDPDTGIMYTCALDHTSPAAPTTFAQDRIANPSRWNATANIPQQRGTWVTAKTYNQGDFVVNSSRYAVCLVGHVSGVFNTDVAAGKWSILIDLSALGVGVNAEAEGTLASAATTNLGSVTPTRVNITGNTTITSFGNTANTYKILRFSAALSITGSANIILTGGVASRVTDAGSIMFVASDSTGKWYELFYTPATAPAAIPDASETVKGLIELATVSEATTGTDTVRAVTPAGLAASVAAGVALAISTIRDGVGATLDTLAEIASALNLLAPQANPTFTGTVTVPTPSLNDDSTKAASTAYVVDEIADKTQAADGTSMVLIHGIDAAAASTVQFNVSNAPSAFDGTFKQMQLRISSLTVGVDDVRLFFRIGTGGGPTIQSGATDYSWHSRGTRATTHQDLEDASDNQIYITDNVGGISLGIGNAAGECFAGIIDIMHPMNSSNFKPFKFSSEYINAGGDLYTLVGGGFYLTATTAITAIEFGTPAGSALTGRFALYGIKNT